MTHRLIASTGTAAVDADVAKAIDIVCEPFRNLAIQMHNSGMNPSLIFSALVSTAISAALSFDIPIAQVQELLVETAEALPQWYEKSAEPTRTVYDLTGLIPMGQA